MFNRLFDRLHKKPFQFEVTILDSEDFHEVEKYSQIRPQNNLFGMTDLSFNNPYGSLPQLQFELHDPENNIDPDKVRKGNIVMVQGTKDINEVPLYNFSFCKIQKIRDIETIEGNNFQVYECVGTAKIIQDSVIHYVRNAQYKNLRKGRSNIETNTDKSSVYHHLMTLLTDKNVLPSNFGYTLQERGGFLIDEISKKLTEAYPSINKSYTKATDLINELADYCGCVWGVDEYNKIYFRKINEETLGHVFKTYHTGAENPDYTALILDRQIEKVSSIDSNDGYFDVNFAFVSQSNLYDVGGDVVNFKSTYNADICVRCKAGTSRFRNLTLTVSRVGAGTDANNPNETFLTGHIANDDGGSVGRNVISRFWHPILEVPETPTNVSVSITTDPADVDVNAYYWIVLHKKGNDEKNTLRWYHDNDISINYTDHWSGIRPVFGRTSIQDAYVPVGWQLSNHGPVFSYAFANYSNIPNVAYNPFSMQKSNKRAPVETVYSVNWIKDVYTMQKFLNLTSFTGTQEPMTFQFAKVFNPNIPIRSGYTAQLLTKKIAKEENGGILGTITNVGYKMTGRNTDDPAGPSGLNTCSVDFVSYYDPSDYL